VFVPCCILHEVYSIASNIVEGQSWPKPEQVQLRTPKVLEVAPGLYHGGGLLPVDHPTGHYVPCSLFNTTKWCRRWLTKKEVATAFNMPRQVLEVCTAAELDLLTKYPGRTLEHCAKSLPAHEGFIDRWGSYVASGRNRVHEEDTAGVEKNGEL
jgi:hypothetical protein